MANVSLTKFCLCLPSCSSVLPPVKAEARSDALPSKQAGPFPHPRCCVRRCKESHGGDPEGRYDEGNDLSPKRKKCWHYWESFHKAKLHIRLIDNSRVHLSWQRHLVEKCSCYFVSWPSVTDWRCLSTEGGLLVLEEHEIFMAFLQWPGKNELNYCLVLQAIS